MEGRVYAATVEGLAEEANSRFLNPPHRVKATWSREAGAAGGAVLGVTGAFAGAHLGLAGFFGAIPATWPLALGLGMLGWLGASRAGASIDKSMPSEEDCCSEE
jgi:hypothetical protein